MNQREMPSAAERFIRGILPENPVYRQLLGMCPTLAVTGSLPKAVTMGLATTFVVVMSNLVVSALRNLLVPHLRILVYTMTIATFVTIADLFLAAHFPDLSRQLGPYVPLIIVNCLIIGRAEVCASKQNIAVALSDGLGQGAGFLVGLCSLAAVRELLGSGSLFGYAVLPASFDKWVIMVMPPGAFLTLGILIGVVNWISDRRTRRSAHEHGATREAA